MISFVIPAHDEEEWIGRSVAAAMGAAADLGEPCEVIVVDDSSGDRTGEIAREMGARVVRVEHRQIAATRNSGAREAVGEVLFFVDADTLANAEAVGACLGAVRKGAVGGGCVMTFDRPFPTGWLAVYRVGVAAGRALKLVGGCFLYCRTRDFEAIGGFDESLFAAEEVWFLKKLRKRGRLVIPRPTVLTSARKFDVMSTRELLTILARVATGRTNWLRSREGLGLWYEPERNRERRETGEAAGGS